MVGFIGSAKSGEFFSMFFPREIAAVDDGTTYMYTLSIHIFGCGVGDDVCSEFKWAAIDRCSERVVNNKRNIMFVGYSGKFFNIQYLHARIGKRLSEKKFGFRTESGSNCFIGSILVNKCDFDSHLLKGGSQ